MTFFEKYECDIAEAVAQMCSVKKAPQACNFIKKETLAQVFSCEFCEISKNTFFYRTPLVAASDIASYAHDNTLHACDSNLYTVLSKLENCTHSMFTWFKENHIKPNGEK